MPAELPTPNSKLQSGVSELAQLDERRKTVKKQIASLKRAMKLLGTASASTCTRPSGHDKILLPPLSPERQIALGSSNGSGIIVHKKVFHFCRQGTVTKVIETFPRRIAHGGSELDRTRKIRRILAQNRKD